MGVEVGRLSDVDQQAMKKAAAEKAVNDYVKDGMTVGLGTGSTAYFAIKRVGELVKQGYDLKCVTTSSASECLAQEFGIKTADLNDIDSIDVTIDGADEVDPKMNLIKGLGGALLREKIVAAASQSEVIVVDESKIVKKLGTKAPLPVEVLRFGHTRTAYGLKRQGCEPVLRKNGSEPFITDGGNYIYDCRFPDGIDNPFFLQSAVDTIPGVIECGLFLNMTSAVIVAHSDGSVRLLE